ncbi:MAG: glycosyltransferase family 2 protein [Bacteroidetes bacterium]|nr:glycosyltransferase family 2 protein [Bacteroidota bacterium]
MPFFSIVIPAYNREAMIADTLNSVLSQAFTGFEVIVVDDGSTDHTRQVLKEKFGTEPKIKIILQENMERGAARNNGFRNSSGEYVVFFDSDDLMHADHLETLHRGITQNQFPDFIATKFVLRRENRIIHSDLANLTSGTYDYRLFLNGNPLACNICVKRKNPGLLLFEEDRRYAIKEDWMFLLQNLRHTKMFLIDKVTITMTDHENRSMRTDQEQIIQKTFLSAEWIKKNVPLNRHELRLLHAHANYFSAIHSYIDARRMKALEYLWRAVRLNGLKKKYILLAMKILPGKKMINKIFA